MIDETVLELARCYLISHGAKGYNVPVHYKKRSFEFRCQNRKFGLFVSVPGMWIRYKGHYNASTYHGATIDEINITPWRNIDERDPSFDPEVFFKPLLKWKQEMERSNPIISGARVVETN